MPNWVIPGFENGLKLDLPLDNIYTNYNSQEKSNVANADIRGNRYAPFKTFGDDTSGNTYRDQTKDALSTAFDNRLKGSGFASLLSSASKANTNAFGQQYYGKANTFSNIAKQGQGNILTDYLDISDKYNKGLFADRAKHSSFFNEYAKSLASYALTGAQSPMPTDTGTKWSDYASLIPSLAEFGKQGYNAIWGESSGTPGTPVNNSYNLG